MTPAVIGIALGIAGSVPSPALEGVPTFKSLGYPGFTTSTTWGRSITTRRPSCTSRL